MARCTRCGHAETVHDVVHGGGCRHEGDGGFDCGCSGFVVDHEMMHDALLAIVDAARDQYRSYMSGDPRSELPQDILRDMIAKVKALEEAKA